MLLSTAISHAFKDYIALQNAITHDFELSGIAPLESATPTQVSYIDQDKYIVSLADSKAGAVLIRASLADKVPSHIQPLIVENPHLVLPYSHSFLAKMASRSLTASHALQTHK